MALDFASLVYTPNYDVFARVIHILPVGSQPGEPTYQARGIYHTKETDVMGENDTIVSDQQTLLDILEPEFAVLPAQFDRITIPAEGAIRAEGTFEVVDTSTNGGGETTLKLRRFEDPKPV